MVKNHILSIAEQCWSLGEEPETLWPLEGLQEARSWLQMNCTKSTSSGALKDLAWLIFRFKVNDQDCSCQRYDGWTWFITRLTTTKLGS